jgi:hypothetical protein
LPFASFYANGIMMGLSPRQIGQCSLWQYRALIAGWNKGHESHDDQPPVMSNEEYDALLEQYTVLPN